MTMAITMAMCTMGWSVGRSVSWSVSRSMSWAMGSSMSGSVAMAMSMTSVVVVRGMCTGGNVGPGTAMGIGSVDDGISSVDIASTRFVGFNLSAEAMSIGDVIHNSPSAINILKAIRAPLVAPRIASLFTKVLGALRVLDVVSELVVSVVVLLSVGIRVTTVLWVVSMTMSVSMTVSMAVSISVAAVASCGNANKGRQKN